MNIKKSEELYKKACEYMPGGVNSPVRACRNVGTVPLFIEKTEGSRITDADGNNFINYVCSWGPDILGAAFSDVISAVKSVCEKGLTFGACHEGEIKLAELINRCIPSMEELRLVNSGTEAVMSAVRAARGFTGKDYIIKFEGCYHGHSDCLLVKGGSGLMTQGIPDSAGVPEGCTRYTLSAVFNDRESVEALFREYKDRIACVIVEPCAANMGVVPAEPGFLEFLRKITEENSALLIFDEVITGFRLSLGGAQEKYGVTPDMTTVGKIVGGGMPLAAYGGRREIMECVAPQGAVYQAGTLSGNPVATAAGAVTLEKLLSHPEVYDELEKKSAKLEEAYLKSGFNVNREGSLMTVFFTDRKVKNYDDVKNCDTQKFAKYYRFMLENGIYAAPSQFEAMFVSAAHSDEDIDRTCSVIEAAGKYMGLTD